MGLHRAFLLLVSASLASCFWLGAWAGEPKAKLASLEWPPYSSAELPGGGVTVAALRSALAEVGWGLEVEFLPWKRAVEVARAGTEGFVGYFPEYFDETNTEFVLSQPMGVSPVGFAEPADKRFTWGRLEDLSALGAIGVVDGYANSPDFDAAVLSGALKVESVSEDLLNLRKILAGRIRAAVIDRRVMDYLVRNDKALSGSASRLAFNETLLIEQKLYAAFRRSPEAEAVRVALNRGLALLGDDAAKRHRQLDGAPRPPLVAQR